ncbi:MAG: hypothetical protein JF596_21065 [Stenotrophomonas sp.]|nr:hypothetical protein [Stenotrophomonas sp.]
MNLEQLIELVRLRTDDQIVPPKVTDEQLAGFATEGEREAAERSRLLFDDAPAPHTTINVLAGQATYTLHPSVFFVDAAEFTPASTTRARALDLRGMDWIRGHCDWRRRRERPCALAEDGRHTVRLWPEPSTAGTLQLSVYRYPLAPLVDLSDVPEIEPAHHEALAEWMLYKYFMVPDEEIEDPDRAAIALGVFETRFGARVDADILRKHRERRRVTTRYGGL